MDVGRYSIINFFLLEEIMTGFPERVDARMGYLLVSAPSPHY
jgi:hypothetical protein